MVGQGCPNAGGGVVARSGDEMTRSLFRAGRVHVPEYYDGLEGIGKGSLRNSLCKEKKKKRGRWEANDGRPEGVMRYPRIDLGGKHRREKGK